MTQAPAPPPAEDALVGQTVGDEFDIVRKLGEGGYGAVYEAVDRTLRRKVAVKMMLASRASNKEYVSKFLREARTAAQLSHPNVVAIHQVGFDKIQRTHYLAMEYVEGRTLHDILQERGPLPVDEAVDILSQCCRGLEVAHRKNIIHRDIKPGNIMITPTGGVKIADFGLAKIFDADEQAKSMVIGTPFFMPPEQFEGKAKDGRTDIYALGVTFYYMLTMKRPYSGSTPAQILVNIMTREPQPVTELRPELPESVWEIVRRMIHKDLEKRYQDCGEILADLQKLRRPDEGEKVYCPACGVPNDADTDRCRGCSASMRERCPVCGAEEAIGVKFCGECGANVPLEREVKTLLDEGRALVGSGDFTMAIERVRGAQERSPENSEVASLLREIESHRDQREHERTACSALLASGDFDGADQRIRAALERYPDDASLAAMLGDLERARAASRTGQGRHAVEALLRARRYSEAREAAERLMMSEGRTPELLELARQAQEVLRTVEETLKGARDLEARGSRTAALDAWRRVLEIAPDHREARKAVARIEEAVGALEGMLDVARRSLDAGDPDDAVARLNELGDRGADDPRVKSLHEEALDAAGALRTGAARVQSLLDAGDAAGAAREFESLRTRFAASPAVARLAAALGEARATHEREERRAALQALAAAGDWGRVLEEARAYLGEYPGDADVERVAVQADETLRRAAGLVASARDAEAAGRLADAARAFAAAAAIVPLDAACAADAARTRDAVARVEDLLARAAAAREGGREDDEDALLREAAEVWPADPRVHDGLEAARARREERFARLRSVGEHLAAGRIDEALAALDDYDRSRPGDAEGATLREIADALALARDVVLRRAEALVARPGRETEAAAFADLLARIAPADPRGADVALRARTGRPAP